MEYVGFIVFFAVFVCLIVFWLYLASQEYEVRLGKDGKFYIKNCFRDFAITEILNSRVLVCRRGKIISISANKIHGFWIFAFVNREIGLEGFY